MTWAMFGDGPWSCPCGKTLTKRGTGSDDAVIHHHDEDRTNNERANLEVMCGACHRSHHHKGRPKSEQMKARNAATQRGRVFTPEHREKLRLAALRRYHD